MKKVLFLRPHLGVPFKEHPKMFNDESNLPAIRVHWKNFMDRMISNLDSRDDVDLYVFDGPMHVLMSREYTGFDFVFVPHRTKAQYSIPDTTCLYYMQTVFPHMFTIDKSGWGGSADYYPFGRELEYCSPHDRTIYDSFCARARSGLSKFDQPKRSSNLKRCDIFVPLQLPHDETIKYHSPCSVEEFVRGVAEWCVANQKTVVFKGHPINLASMAPLEAIINKFDRRYVSYEVCGNVHDFIEHADKVYTINSGVGFEALLHKKPLVTFGKSEYDCVSFKCSLNSVDMDSAYKSVFFDEGRTIQLFNHFLGDVCIDSSKPIEKDILS
jgi:hypothetical protein